MITLNDISVNKNTYKDILQKSYYGYDFSTDSRKIAVLRSGIHKWDTLDETKRQKLKNDMIILLNVFDNEQLVRFLLSNIPQCKWKSIFIVLISIESILDVYHNIDGKNIFPIDYLAEEDFND